MGVNQITGSDPTRIVETMKSVDENYDEMRGRFRENPFGDGKASERIVRILREKLEVMNRSPCHSFEVVCELARAALVQRTRDEFFRPVF